MSQLHTVLGAVARRSGLVYSSGGAIQGRGYGPLKTTCPAPFRLQSSRTMHSGLHRIHCRSTHGYPPHLNIN